MSEPGNATGVLRSKWFLPVAGIAAVLLFSIGAYVYFVLPGKMVASAKQSAEAQITSATSALKEAQATLPGLAWFKESYTSPLEQSCNSAKAALEGGPDSAAKLMAQGESGSWSARRDAYKKAEAQAKAAYTSAQTVVTSAARARQARDEAGRRLSAFSARFGAATEAQQEINRRIEVETPRYPARYGIEIRAKRDGITSGLNPMSGLSASVTAILPENGTRVGDPDAALSQLNPALTRLDEIDTSAKAILSYLNTVKHQADGASAKVDECNNIVAATQSGLGKRKRETGYWLKAATAALETAKAKAETAESLLTAVKPEDGVADLPKAYLTADEAIGLCGNVLKSADSEIAAAAAVETDSKTFASEIDSFAELAESVRKSHATLQSNHASSIVSKYNGILERCGPEGERAFRRDLRDIRDDISLEKQRFEEAKKELAERRKALSEGKAQANEFIGLVRSLENARKSYPDELENAQQIISAQRANVEKYGASDTASRDDFDEAVKLVKSGAQHAKDREWSAALDDVRTAAKKAADTGAQCKAAYERQQAARSSGGGSSGHPGGSRSSGGSGHSSTPASSPAATPSHHGSDSSGGSHRGSDSDGGSHKGSDSDWGSHPKKKPGG